MIKIMKTVFFLYHFCIISVKTRIVLLQNVTELFRNKFPIDNPIFADMSNFQFSIIV